MCCTYSCIENIEVVVTRCFNYVYALVYTSLHATLLLISAVTLNAVINTKNNALITLLIVNNFVELKRSVFKSYKIQNMF